jgi:hypothetical protein
MSASLSVGSGLRGRLGLLLTVGAIAAAVGAGMGGGLTPSRVEARYSAPIVEPVECDPMAFAVPGVVVNCDRDADGRF